MRDGSGEIYYRIKDVTSRGAGALYGSMRAQELGIKLGRVNLDTDLLVRPEEAMSLLQWASNFDDGHAIKIQWLRAGAALHFAEGMILELRFAYSGTTDEELCDLAGFHGGLTLDHLYTVKMSHRYLRNSPHFEKTRFDILEMRRHGAKIFDQEFLKRREAETYTYGHPSLEREKADFFSGDGVNYVYDHDSIHQAVAICPQPAYQYYAEPGREVKSSKALFDQVNPIIRLQGVIEEAMVLAIERSLVPFPPEVLDDAHIQRTFKFALQKVCTSITSGWFREYAWENYEAALVAGNELSLLMWGRFQRGLDDGTVKPYEGGTY